MLVPKYTPVHRPKEYKFSPTHTYLTVVIPLRSCRPKTSFPLNIIIIFKPFERDYVLLYDGQNSWIKHVLQLTLPSTTCTRWVISLCGTRLDLGRGRTCRPLRPSGGTFVGWPGTKTWTRVYGTLSSVSCESGSCLIDCSYPEWLFYTPFSTLT